MKNKLKKYNIKREIYKIENLDEVKNIIKEIQEEMKSEKLEVLPEIKQCDVVKCKYCNLIFTSTYEMYIHLENCNHKNNKIPNSMHNLTTKVNSLKCPGCMKVFKHKQSKSRHIKTCKILLSNKSKCKDNQNLEEEIKTLKNSLKLNTITNNNKEFSENDKTIIFHLNDRYDKTFNENMKSIIKYINDKKSIEI